MSYCSWNKQTKKDSYITTSLEPLPSFVRCAQQITGLPAFSAEEAKLPKFTCKEAEKLLLNTSFSLPKLQAASLSWFTIAQVLLKNEVLVIQSWMKTSVFSSSINVFPHWAEKLMCPGKMIILNKTTLPVL